MDDNDPIDQTLSNLIGSSAPTIADEDSAYRMIVNRAHGRVVHRRLVASAATMALVAAVAITIGIAGPRSPQVRVRGHSAPGTTTPAPESTTTPTTAPESTTTGVPSTTTNTSPPPSLPSVDRALDLTKGTVFGIAPGNGVTPEAVLDTLTPILGPPTRDTGWYITESRPGGDCLGNTRQRILRWGSLSFAFWNPHESPAQFTLWGWALGKTADQREPQPVVDQPPVAATTPDGVGIGTPLTELRARYGAGVQVAADEKTVFMSTSSNGFVFFSLTDGNVSGIQSRLAFC